MQDKNLVTVCCVSIIQDGLKCAYKAIADNNKIYFGIK